MAIDTFIDRGIFSLGGFLRSIFSSSLPSILSIVLATLLINPVISCNALLTDHDKASTQG